MSPRMKLDLNTSLVSRLTSEESPTDLGFKVTVPNVRDYVFAGSNAAIVDDWVNALFQTKAPNRFAATSIVTGMSFHVRLFV